MTTTKKNSRAPGRISIEDGIRFECQGTGKCCQSRGEYGYVYLGPRDQKRLATHLDLTVREMRDRHCDETDGFVHLKDPDKTCNFLEGKRCTVYEGRPDQCRTWPFWPENMDAKTWNEEVVPFCPGVGKGRLYSRAEIEEQLKLDPLADDEDEAEEDEHDSLDEELEDEEEDEDED